MEYEIIKGEERHLEAVVQLWSKHLDIPENTDPDSFARTEDRMDLFRNKTMQCIAGDWETLFVLLVKGKVGGFILAGIVRNNFLYNSVRYCGIESLVVDEFLRGRGLGTLLVQQAISWGQQFDAQRIILNVFAGNKSSYGFFKKLGFGEKHLTMELSCEKQPEANQKPAVAPDKETSRQETPSGQGITKEQFETLLPLACKWAGEQEQEVLSKGMPLNEEQRKMAAFIGVREIDKVRLLPVSRIPVPANETLKLLVEQTGLVTQASAGITFRHGIFVRDDHWDQKNVLVHELCHTMQYERLGDLEAFLHQYLSECIGQGNNPCSLEREARMYEQAVFPGKGF